VKGVFQHWPNRITASRFVGALVLFTLLALIEQGALTQSRVLIAVAFWLFVALAATDALDGYLARRDKHVTAFGRIADPFTDKVLIVGTMIFLTTMDPFCDWLPPWIVVLVLSREFLVTGLRGYVESIGGEFPADTFGKIKMIIQCFAVGGILFLEAFSWPEVWRAFWDPLVHLLVWGTLFTTLGSGVTYVMRTVRILRELDR
jgi:CDP-diacylglycerol--glycerol-3-phosphate 3-phosphatidyltransferase